MPGMKPNPERNPLVHRILKITLLLLALLLLWLGLNYRQLIAHGTTWNETARLHQQSKNLTTDSQNPAPQQDLFDGKLSPQFWKFTTIKGAGQVSNESTWHAAAIAFEHNLLLQHFPDSDFSNENADMFQSPAADQYNNVTLIGGSGFRPTPAEDVILKFTSRVSEDYYGSAGVIFQPEGTLQKDGTFAKPFDMFGFAVMGDESNAQEVSGALCYLPLNWTPAEVQALPIDAHTWYEYTIRLHWIDQTEWLGTVAVDGEEMCSMTLPAFGALEVQAWRDNALVTTQPHHWWEIAPTLEMGFQNGGTKQFELGSIQIYAEAR
jgi:hypothetical protein